MLTSRIHLTLPKNLIIAVTGCKLPFSLLNLEKPQLELQLVEETERLLLQRLSCDVLAVSLEVRLTCVGEVKRSEERVVVFGSYSGVGRVKKNPVGAQQLLHRLLQLLLLLDDEGWGSGRAAHLNQRQTWRCHTHTSGSVHVNLCSHQNETIRVFFFRSSHIYFPAYYSYSYTIWSCHLHNLSMWLFISQCRLSSSEIEHFGLP